MKNTSILALSLCAFFSAASYANDSAPCLLVPDSSIMEVVSATGGDHVPNCDYVTQIEKLLFDIQTFSEDKVKVNITMRRSYSGASFDGGHNIEIPERLEFYGKWGEVYGVSVMSNYPVVAHEYGHALLEEKLLRELGPKYPIVKAYSESRRELSRLQMLVLQDPANKDYQDQLAQKTEVMRNNLAQTRYFKITAPYSELYADVVAAFNDNSKTSILNALYYDQMSIQEFRFIQTRSFDYVFDEKTYGVYMTDCHGYFAFARTYIGKNLWPSKNAAEKAKILKKIGDAIIIEVKKLLDKNAEDVPHYRIGNEAFIKTLSSLK